ncbi:MULTISPECIES: hypothetical protein [unclassified Synechocystis]|jgi:hypothetical protein|uniref:hypothetical protein n=1 Tax=unclassified Synechocystis TaxID=2640012 RepID=UPI0008FFCFBC|nr:MULTISPECIES: hypothetical protein [unclassified Synechocystis]AVP89534.1 hypothetical protein C7I86_07475 [Synechocystis sp. IPPAS B-1465]MBD2619495.1 hypothetical protein [Synechocystis sp. FACHB-898]MBD2639925.1 hypothetical protein [Synechocystis sp. FACHB-908]MBD2662144.1 hypothetical protein [Synechocystis sp. FACHB-929]MCW5240920.1 hypothetical protein [Synechocystis sp. PCC 6803]
MNKFESRQSEPKTNNNAGWIIHVYDKSRRLLFVLEPSHAWLFFLGCGVGLLLSVVWVNVARHSPPLESSPVKVSPPFQVD